MNQEDNTQSHIALVNGTKICQYRIESKIGAGGMGEVYLAEDTKLERKVALKFLPSDLTCNDELKSRFIREAKAIAKLNHPNIITIFEVGDHQGRPFFAMDYVDGKNLRHFIKAEQISINEIVDIAIQTCQGLAEAHRNGIIHRDIKAANIVLDSQKRVRILDFGLASMAGAEELTKTGSTLGTVAYMSPEQVSGRSVDHRSDLFSFGIILYELLSGESPFKRPNDGATLQAIMQETPEPITRYKNDVPEYLQNILAKLLEKNLELRYQSAEGVIADLKRLLYDSKPTTGSVSLDKTDDKSIVVIPFNNMSADADNEYFSDGLTEEIITDLSGIGELRVISRTSSLQLKGTTKDIPVIGQELNVRYILTGSVRKAGNNVRITSQLIDTVTNQQVWADKYKGTLEDIFEIQEEVSQSIVSTLHLKLTSQEKKQLVDRPIENATAYEYYMRAKQELGKWNKEGLDQAKFLIEEALAITGDNALLLAKLAHIQYQYVNIGVKDESELPVIENYLARAEKIDPNITDIYLVKSFIAQTFTHDKADSIYQLKKILEREPNNATAHIWLTIEYGLVGQVQKAKKHLETVYKIDPISTHRKTTGMWVNLMNGEFDELLESAYHIFKLEPDSLFQRNRLVHVLCYLNRVEEAKKYISALTGDSYYQRMGLSIYYAKSGEKEKALSYMDENAIRTTKRDPQYSFYVAFTYAALGDDETTIELLENAFEKGFFNYPYMTEHDLSFKHLHDNPRFKTLLANMKKAWENFDG